MTLKATGRATGRVTGRVTEGDGNEGDVTGSERNGWEVHIKGIS